MKRVKDKGFTFIELLVVIGVVAILIAFLLAALNPLAQARKARDGRRKRDLDKLKVALENYHNDHGCYPDAFGYISNVLGSFLVPDYLNSILSDPKDELPNIYYYSVDSGSSCPSWYKIYGRLENDQDPVIAQVNCNDGCGPPLDDPAFNYWVSSANVSLTDAGYIEGEDWSTWPPD